MIRYKLFSQATVESPQEIFSQTFSHPQSLEIFTAAGGAIDDYTLLTLCRKFCDISNSHYPFKSRELPAHCHIARITKRGVDIQKEVRIFLLVYHSPDTHQTFYFPIVFYESAHTKESHDLKIATALTRLKDKGYITESLLNISNHTSLERDTTPLLQSRITLFETHKISAEQLIESVSTHIHDDQSMRALLIALIKRHITFTFSPQQKCIQYHQSRATVSTAHINIFLESLNDLESTEIHAGTLGLSVTQSPGEFVGLFSSVNINIGEFEKVKSTILIHLIKNFSRLTPHQQSKALHHILDDSTAFDALTCPHPQILLHEKQGILLAISANADLIGICTNDMDNQEKEILRLFKSLCNALTAENSHLFFSQLHDTTQSVNGSVNWISDLLQDVNWDAFLSVRKLVLTPKTTSFATSPVSVLTDSQPAPHLSDQTAFFLNHLFDAYAPKDLSDININEVITYVSGLSPHHISQSDIVLLSSACLLILLDAGSQPTRIKDQQVEIVAQLIKKMPTELAYDLVSHKHLNSNLLYAACILGFKAHSVIEAIIDVVHAEAKMAEMSQYHSRFIPINQYIISSFIESNNPPREFFTDLRMLLDLTEIKGTLLEAPLFYISNILSSTSDTFYLGEIIDRLLMLTNIDSKQQIGAYTVPLLELCGPIVSTSVRRHYPNLYTGKPSVLPDYSGVLKNVVKDLKPRKGLPYYFFGEGYNHTLIFQIICTNQCTVPQFINHLLFSIITDPLHFSKNHSELVGRLLLIPFNQLFVRHTIPPFNQPISLAQVLLQFAPLRNCLMDFIRWTPGADASGLFSPIHRVSGHKKGKDLVFSIQKNDSLSLSEIDFLTSTLDLQAPIAYVHQYFKLFLKTVSELGILRNDTQKTQLTDQISTLLKLLKSIKKAKTRSECKQLAQMYIQISDFIEKDKTLKILERSGVYKDTIEQLHAIYPEIQAKKELAQTQLAEMQSINFYLIMPLFIVSISVLLAYLGFIAQD